MAAALLARAGGPLRRGECARAAPAEPQGFARWRCWRRVLPRADERELPLAERALCPSSVASGACRAPGFAGTLATARFPSCTNPIASSCLHRRIHTFAPPHLSSSRGPG